MAMINLSVTVGVIGRSAGKATQSVIRPCDVDDSPVKTVSSRSSQAARLRVCLADRLPPISTSREQVTCLPCDICGVERR